MQAPTTSFPLCDPDFLDWMLCQGVAIQAVYPLGCVANCSPGSDARDLIDSCSYSELREMFGPDLFPEQMTTLDGRDLWHALCDNLMDHKVTGLLLEVTLTQRQYRKEDAEAHIALSGMYYIKPIFAPAPGDIEPMVRAWVEEMITIMKSKPVSE